MTALWILLGAAALLAALLSGSVTIYVRISDEIRISAGAFGYRRGIDLSGEEKPEKPERKPKRVSADKEKAAKKKKELAGEKPSERSFPDTVELALLLMRSVLPGAARLLSRLRFTAVRVAVSVGGEEADRTAVRYGAVSAGIYNLLAALDSACTLRVKSVDVTADFVSGETVYDISFKVKLRIARILGAGVGILAKFLANLIHERNQKKEDAAKPASAIKE